MTQFLYQDINTQIEQNLHHIYMKHYTFISRKLNRTQKKEKSPPILQEITSHLQSVNKLSLNQEEFWNSTEWKETTAQRAVGIWDSTVSMASAVFNKVSYLSRARFEV